MQPRLKGFNLWKVNNEGAYNPWVWANSEYYAYSDGTPFGRTHWRRSTRGRMEEWKKSYYTFQLPGEFFC